MLHLYFHIAWRVEPLKIFCLAHAMKVCWANNWNEPSSVAWPVVVREVELGRELVVGDPLGCVIFPSIAWVKNSAYVCTRETGFSHSGSYLIQTEVKKNVSMLVRCPYFRG